MRKKIKLTKEAKFFHRLWSVQLMGLLAFFSFMEGALPYWKDVIPMSAYPWVVGVVSTLAALSRLIKQSSLDGEQNEQSGKAADQ